MTFFDAEKTTHGGQPIELFEFTLAGGNQAEYNYTNYHEEISELGNTYLPATIRRLPFASADVENRLELEVEMAPTLGIVNEMLILIPPRRCTLIVRRYHGNIGANASLIWKGEVANTRLAGNLITMRVPSLLGQTMEADVPWVILQSQCNHVLFDGRCPAVRASFTENTTVASIDSNNPRLVTVTSLSGAADGVHDGGEIIRVTDGERRFILKQVGTVLTLDRAFRTLFATDAIDVAQGCDHLVDTCDTKFNVLEGFGGEPYLQSNSLFRYGVRGDGG
jgi:hypothetical protein